ncbi:MULTISPECIES: DUF5313 domain-containing protein [unclassified Gordonia (in: high G+C Gram-positive bacteria)]|uniref:DUF5313 domain-containing protein n=1 Tax=unclassified Gordonia (in: high G+C Gram-positive bacteria) TaxID=2657482 RepID=UPI00071E11C8|nr:MULTISPECIES: DUF5313 domain-containing protein [unclassified Gordonia (in: high G+C Gram-positive bacteria)]KSU58429.1 hypothetical protein AS181_10020 [Gordonia sp. SGD-V-85]SCC19933.1 hypothetical protein GA0061091_10727 [Gordonia sp. v-85]
MNRSPESARPTWGRQVAYWYGGRLPASMTDWVRNDLAGPGASVRMVARWSIPCILLLLPMLFVPAPWGVRITMTMPILLSYLFFSIALNRVYRRYRLVQHGLDPELVNAVDRVKNADLYAEYHRKYRGENGRPVSVSR